VLPFCLHIDVTVLQTINGPNGIIWIANEWHGNTYEVTAWPASTSPVVFGGVGAASDDTLVVTNYLGTAGAGTLLRPGGLFALASSLAAAALASGGTIATDQLGVSRVAPTAAVTGAILATGTWAGQIVQVINESAHTITFAASGTSHVADGTGDVIAGTTARQFVWDGGTLLWYRLA
jgi:hypothetical protein